MNRPNDGGPAFPAMKEAHAQEEISAAAYNARLIPGMSLRAYLAAEAICLFEGDVSTEFIARSCCNIADALIAELEKEVEEPPKPKFKEGDRVRVRLGVHGRVAGMVGTVQGVLPRSGGQWKYRIEIPDGEGVIRGKYAENRLEPAGVEKPKAEFKVGDPVRVRAGIGVFAGKAGVVEAVFPDTIGEGFKYRVHITDGMRETYYECQLEAVEEGEKDESAN